jgi:hypothetical protein
VTRRWRKLRGEELHDMTSAANIIRIVYSRRMRRSGRVARVGESRSVRRSSVPEFEGKRSFGIPRRRRNINNKMDIKEIMWDNMA